MRIPVALGVLLALHSAPLIAQTTTATPAGKGFETKDGGDQLATGWNIGYAYQLGNLPTAHVQYIDDELQGPLRVIKSVAYRMDNTSHTATTAAGRSWTNVTLGLGETSWSGASTIFTQNLASPTMVFSGSVNWPTYTGYVNAAAVPPAPAPIQTAHTFPFTAPWIYTGTAAIVQDLTFTGGTFANNAAWSNGDSAYHLDGAIVVTSMGTGAYTYPSGATCHDSAITAGTTTTYAAQMVTQYNQYSKAYPGVLNDSIEVPVQSTYTAPNAPVIHGLGLQSYNNGIGVAIGFACNNLILDTTAFIQFYAIAGALPNAQTPRVTVTGKRTAANLAVPIWLQGAWTDSVTNKPSLTRASKVQAPGLGMTEVEPKKLLVYSASTAAVSGTKTSPTSWTSHPLTFYIQ